MSRRVAEHPPGELRCVEGRPPEPTRGSAVVPTAPRQAQQQQNREEGDQVLHNHDDGAMLSIMEGNGAQHLRLHLQHSQAPAMATARTFAAQKTVRVAAGVAAYLFVGLALGFGGS